MEIRIKEMDIINFKGIRNLSVKFNENVTNIRGGNGTGKTSIADAFMWLLFGRDSRGRSEFAIKTLDSRGREIPKIEHSVKGTFEIDGCEMVLKKSLNEKWVKKRGCRNEVYMGNECVYEIDGAVLKQWEYQKKISEIIDEDVFMLVTNPMIFTGRKWQVQRKVLMDMAELGSEYDIAVRGGFDGEMYRNKSADEILRELGDEKKRLIREKDLIPVRIDEIKRNILCNVKDEKTVQAELYNIKEEIFKKECEIKELKEGDDLIGKLRADVKKAEALLSEKKAEDEERTACIKMRNADRRYKHQKDINDIKYELEDIKRLIAQCENKIREGKNVGKSLKNEYENIKLLKFDDKCPVCRRKWSEDDRKARLENFENEKNKRLCQLNEKTEKTESERAFYENEIIVHKKREKELENALIKKGEFKEEECVKADLSEYENEVIKAEKALEMCCADTSKQEKELMDLRKTAGELECELSKINREKDNLKRIKELEESYEIIKSQIGDIELKEDHIKEFIKYKVDIMGEKVNSKFNAVRFKLFDYHINGGYRECCEAMVKGVPFSDVNSAMKINAGLDIIRTLQRYYNVFAPVFIDNRESINEIGYVDSQLICLEVTGDRNIVVR